MKLRITEALGAAFFIITAFAFPIKAVASQNSDLNEAGAVRSIFSAAAAISLPEPVAGEIQQAAETAIGQEELDYYRAVSLENEPDDSLSQAPQTEPYMEKGVPGKAAGSLGGDGKVKLYNQWTKETLEIQYRGADGGYAPGAAARIKHFFRCRLNGQEIDIPIKLVEILDALQEKFNGKTITVFSGYRSPALNAALAANSNGVAKNSLHLRGMAADIGIPGVGTAALRDAAKALHAGGVGYYPIFVHVDVGAVRYW